MNKINVLYYNSSLQKGGTDIYMINVVKNLNKEKFNTEVLIKDGDTIDNQLKQDLENNGIFVNCCFGSFFKQILGLKIFFKKNKNKYDLIHINAVSKSVGIVAYFAKKYGKIKKIIFHSHAVNTSHGRFLIDKFGEYLIKKYTTIFATCSQIAGEYMFGKKIYKNKPVYKLNNSVDTDKFCYDKNVREKTRKELNINLDNFVMIHVGRFIPVKNHKKNIEVFNALTKIEPNSNLILIGSGPLVEETKKLVDSYNITDKVFFLGEQENVSKYLQCADCFVMPSIYEGLPIVAVEAQSTGLPCVLSKNISKETQLIDNVTFVELDLDNELWAKEVLKYKGITRSSQKSTFKKLGFDKDEAIKIIENLYSE